MFFACVSPCNTFHEPNIDANHLSKQPICFLIKGNSNVFWMTFFCFFLYNMKRRSSLKVGYPSQNVFFIVMQLKRRCWVIFVSMFFSAYEKLHQVVKCFCTAAKWSTSSLPDTHILYVFSFIAFFQCSSCASLYYLIFFIQHSYELKVVVAQAVGKAHP